MENTTTLFSPTYKQTRVKLPPLKYPRKADVLLEVANSSADREDMYIPFKKSIVDRRTEIVGILKAGILERSEWLQTAANGTAVPPVFTNKMTRAVFGVDTSDELAAKLDKCVATKLLTSADRSHINLIKKHYKEKIEAESREFLDDMEEDIALRYPDPSESMLASIERDKKRELGKISARNLSDMQAELSAIKYTNIKAPVGVPQESNNELKLLQHRHREQFYLLIEEIDCRHAEETEEFEAAALDFSSNINVLEARELFLKEHELERKRLISEFSDECTRQSRPIKASMVTNVSRETVDRMVDLCSSKMDDTAAWGTRDYNVIMKYVDQCFTGTCTRGESWESFTQMLAQCWSSVGCPTHRKREFLEMVRMYATLYGSDKSRTFSQLDKQMDELEYEIRTLNTKVKDLDKLVRKECKVLAARSKEASAVEKTRPLSSAAASKQLKYMMTIENSGGVTAEAPKKTKVGRRRPL